MGVKTSTAISSEIVNVHEGDSLGFTVSADGGTTSYQYEWSIGGQTITGEQESTFIFS